MLYPRVKCFSIRPRRIDKSFHGFPIRRRVCGGGQKKKKKKKVNLILRRADNKPVSPGVYRKLVFKILFYHSDP